MYGGWWGLGVVTMIASFCCCPKKKSKYKPTHAEEYIQRDTYNRVYCSSHSSSTPALVNITTSFCSVVKDILAFVRWWADNIARRSERRLDCEMNLGPFVGNN